MSDEELIARLRSMHWCVTTEANGVGVSDSKVALAAADRIEALTTERDKYRKYLDETFAEWEVNAKRLDVADGNLAKAVEALEKAATDMDDYVGRGYGDCFRDTLAEIKAT